MIFMWKPGAEGLDIGGSKRGNIVRLYTKDDPLHCMRCLENAILDYSLYWIQTHYIALGSYNASYASFPLPLVLFVNYKRTIQVEKVHFYSLIH